MFTVFLSSLEKSINHLLRTDPANQAKLIPLVGRTIQIDVTESPQPIYLSFARNAILLSLEKPARIDVTIQGSALAMLRLLQSTHPTAELPNNLHIQGDLTVAQQLSHVARSIDIDWEEELSHWIGDIAAHRIGRLLRGIRNEVVTGKEHISQSIADYLRYESGLYPDNTELEDFLQEVDEVRLAVDRLEAQIKQLTAK